MSRRVVITGMGVVSPVGNDVETFWKSLVDGRSGIGPITRFDSEGYRTRIAGEAQTPEPPNLSAKEATRHDRYSLFAMEAAHQAVTQAGLDMNREDPRKVGCVIGSGIGGIETIANEVVRLHEGGPRRVSPLFIPKGLANMASGNVAIAYGFRGPNKSVVTACASANHAIGEGAIQIQSGRAEVMIVGGSEAPVIPLSIAGFSSMRAMSTRNDEPQRASRPFDKDRDGFVIGEGAGVLVLESEEHARGRGAAIIAEFAGMGESCDAFHIVAPEPEGRGCVDALQFALDEARINPGDVHHYNAHGTSTPLNEVGESRALRTVFGENMPLVTSTKSMTGHLLGAAGAIESIASILAIRDNIVPPTINYETPDPECLVNLVANEARQAKIEIALTNSLGFGGHNAVLVFRRYG